MADPFVGELRIFSFAFPPKGWALCNGQILSIAQNQALFSLLGTMYGGNGQTTFGLPNLQGSVPIHFGQLPGGGSYTQGQIGGVKSVTLNNNQTGHTHIPGAATVGATNSPTNAYPAGSGTILNFASATDGSSMAAAMVPQVGGNQPHPNEQPLLVISICIALVGIFPSRN
jgi:microcystin-dependent protein